MLVTEGLYDGHGFSEVANYLLQGLHSGGVSWQIPFALNRDLGILFWQLANLFDVDVFERLNLPPIGIVLPVFQRRPQFVSVNVISSGLFHILELRNLSHVQGELVFLDIRLFLEELLRLLFIKLILVY